MDYKLSTKNAIGKWQTYGSIKTNQFGKDQASFRLKDLKELVALAESTGKEWVNLAMFQNNENKQEEHSIAKGNAFVAEKEFDLSDKVPF